MRGKLTRACVLLACGCVSSAPAMAGETVTYSYDALGRLVTVSTSGTINNGQSVSISIDPAGNRTNYSINGAGSAGPPTLSIDSPSAFEGANLTFTVTRSGSTSAPVSVTYASANGTAVAPGDYGAVSNSLTFASGQTSKTITVATVDDTLVESSENFKVKLSAPTGGAVLGTAEGTGTIKDNDTSAVLSIADASITEGGALSFTVTKNGSVNSSVSWAAVNGSAVSPGDFTAASGQLTFTATETQKTITIQTVNDALVEGNETMSVQLSNPSGTTISRATATGTILDNDSLLSLSGASAAEGGNLVFTVSRTGTTNTAVSVNFASSNGTAISGSDYTGVSGTLSFAAGQTSKQITVATIDDPVVEPTETMIMTLSAPSTGAVLGTATATGTITDNDVMVPVYRFYKYPRHFMTLSYSEGINAGWTSEGIGFHLFQTGGAGYSALYRCFNPSNGDHFISNQSNCEGKTAEGLMGYAAVAQSGNLVQLYRFYKANTADHLITVNYSEGTQGKYASEGTLGYVVP